MRTQRQQHNPINVPAQPTNEAPSARPFCEASEREDPANDALDRIEEGVRQVLAAGGEFALRQRLARLLPSLG